MKLKLSATVLAAALLLPILAACAGTSDTSTSAPTTTAPAPKPAAAQDEESWKAFGNALTLAQILVRSASAPDPDKAMDDVLAGRSTEANSAIAGLLQEATADMPAEYRARVASMGQDIASMARKQIGKPVPASPERALQARKDLTAMGLKYHDPNEFLAAVERDDALAVELFVEGRGVNLGAKDAKGRTALEIARAKGNEPMAQLLARNLPAAR
ncbi:MAG TPA: hypothetical protein VKE95_22200 [Burkholderiales bacterium]|nr:hypothetical protein [Burkholderiales bacterium]